MTRLPSVLGDPDLSGPELQTMRLDGELLRIAGGWAPVDEPVTPALRARALMAARPERLVAELRAAAWIWGAVAEPPDPVELCADVRARVRLRPGADAVVREVVFDDGDVVRLGGVAVTTPTRTIADLARGGLVGDEVLRALARLGDVDPESVVAALRRRTVAGRRAALQRVERAFAQPLLTR